MFIRRNLLWIVAVGLGWTLAPASVSASEDPASPPASSRSVRVNRLIGMKVENTDGLAFGKLRDLAIDMSTGELKYVLVSSGGFLGIRSRINAVPPSLVSASTAKRNTIAIHVARTRWNNAPALQRADLAALSQPSNERRLHSYYREEIASLTLPSPTESENGAQSTLAPTGREEGDGDTRSRPAALKFAGSLIGRTVLNRQNERLGEVLDLIVRLDANSPVFVLFSSGRMLRDRNDEFVIPARALTLSRDGKVVIDVNRSMLNNASPFDEKAWSEASPTGELHVYRFGRQR